MTIVAVVCVTTIAVPGDILIGGSPVGGSSTNNYANTKVLSNVCCYLLTLSETKMNVPGYQLMSRDGTLYSQDTGLCTGFVAGINSGLLSDSQLHCSVGANPITRQVCDEWTNYSVVLRVLSRVSHCPHGKRECESSSVRSLSYLKEMEKFGG